MPDLGLRLGRDVIVVDGDMDAMFEREGVPADECQALLNVLDPELVVALHERFVLAGAQALTTNSSDATRNRLAAFGLEDKVTELNRAAVRLAKAARPEHVLARVGPCGLFNEPLPPDGERLEEALALYAEQIAALAAEEPDAILIERMTNVADAHCALDAARSVCELPVIVCCDLDASDHIGPNETEPETALAALGDGGADVVGIGCGLGLPQLLPLLERMARATALPLFVRIDADTPQSSPAGAATSLINTTDRLADAALALRQAGAQFIGSGRDSTPAFTGALYATVGGTQVVR